MPCRRGLGPLNNGPVPELARPGRCYALALSLRHGDHASELSLGMSDWKVNLNGTRAGPVPAGPARRAMA